MDVDTLRQAARVSRFLRVDPGHEVVGRWMLYPFSISEDYHKADLLQTFIANRHKPEIRQRELERAVPPGDYIALKRRATQGEKDSYMVDKKEECRMLGVSPSLIPELEYVPVMSDTPAEIDGHMHAFQYAGGRVLVNGLGLGCIVVALLHNADVEHIDVVEIDPDVLKLTGRPIRRYVEGRAWGDRLTIHQADALNPRWPSGVRWDYAWHDIWSHISSRNLDPALAEHGIAYSTLFDMYADRAAVQGAWAYEDALWMKDYNNREEAETRAKNERFWAASYDERVEIMVDQIIREQTILPDGNPAFDPNEPIPAEVRDFFEQRNITEAVKVMLDDAMKNGKLDRAKYDAAQGERPIGDPNAHLRGKS